ncbi:MULTISPECIES: PQQ-dependent sugar dehydrogenase [Cupriavidus]|uniref:Glucose dehydrogenase n=1 Tax=Cupriavidus oxalaticus TaxID=96344 RepID=A0A4P7L4J1_9BURK|nr:MULTISPECIES: PQQ-dependent sugar dehydrogenase [Cupriavidus]MBF6987863.1 PQQ-dependent sugar dehydrogenase [Cupriavidus sp. IK-TO18]QBY49965.1 glucose dehydrogenase [Cupriavidus oxalaticus]
MTVSIRSSLCQWFLACCLGLVACGGGDGGSSGNAGGSGGSGPGGPGTLSLTVTGLPSGTPALVTVTGPGQYRQAVAQSTTLSNLATGTYTVSAADVLAGTSQYQPQPPAQSVTVGAGAGATANVVYGSPQPVRLSLTQVAGGLAEPIYLTAPAGDARLFIVERAGRIRVVRNGTLLGTPFLNIDALTTTDGERGLLSMAFDPGYASNGRFYVYYTDNNGAITIARYQVSAGNPDVADTAGTILLSIPHSNFQNHNGGQLAFGTDGMLYVGTGDGGGGGDPSGNAQNLGVLLGKLLRIDVSGASGQPYGVPSGNPFAGQSGRRGEIWAYGLRNPWRFSFDAGLLYIADVGQGQREEVDVAAATSAGLNYGWNRMEGTACVGAATCDTAGLTLPVFEYGHEAGACAIVGGYVYRGNALAALQGRYFYSDLCTGKLLSFVYRDGGAAEQVDWNVTIPGSVYSFGVDAGQALYVLSDTGTSAASGAVYRVDATVGGQ